MSPISLAQPPEFEHRPGRRAWAAAGLAPWAAALAFAALPLYAGEIQVFTGNEVSTVLAGATSSYTLTVANTGSVARSGVVVSETFDPAHFDLLQWSCLPEFPAGHLQFAAARFDLPAADSLASAGAFVYGSSPAADTIKAYARNPATGALTYLAALANGAHEGDGDTVAGLDGVRGLAASPDGAFLYAISPVDDAVVALKVGAGGGLDWIEAKRDGVGGVDGLDQAAALVVTAGQVYVSGSSDDAVAIFTRNAATGRLTFAGKVFDGQVQGPLTVDGLDGAAGLALSPGGEHLYVAGAVDGAVALFDRDPTTGALTFRAVRSGLAGARALAIAADGAALHVAGAGTLASLPRAATGELGPALQILQNGVAGLSGMALPGALTPSADGAYLYLSSPPDHAVIAFVRDPQGRLTRLETRRDGEAPFTGLAGAAGLLLAPGGGQLYVAGSGAGSIATLSRDTATFCTAGGADDTVATPGLALADIASLAAGARLVYRVDARLRSGALGFVCSDPYDSSRRCVRAAAAATWAGGSASANDVDYLSRQADLTAKIDDGVTSAVPGLPLGYEIEIANLGPSDAAGFEVESFFPAAIAAVTWTCAAEGAGASCGAASGSGDIDFGFSSLPAGTRLRLTADAVVASSARGVVKTGARVVAPAGLLDPDAANDAAVDGDTVLEPRAELRALATSHPPFYAGAPIEITLTVANDGPSDSYGVAIAGLLPTLVEDPSFSCTPPSWAGTPSLLASVPALAGAAGSAVSPDGANLYLAGATGLEIFRRDLKDGGLAALATLHDGDSYFDPVDEASGVLHGLVGARAVLVSADGRHVYVASEGDDALVLFRRETPDGSLVFEASYFDGEGGVAGLGGAAALALSPAGDQLYVAGRADDAIAVFARDPASGTLVFQGAVQEGVAGMSGLAGVSSLAISGDGRHLYAASPRAGGVTVLARAADGSLSRLETVLTTPPLGAGSALAISADGRNLYAAAGAADALVVLLRDVAAASPSFGRLSQLEALAEGGDQGGVALGGLANAGAVTLSADGRQVLVRGDGAVGLFGRRVAELLAPGEAPGRLLCHDLGGGSCARPFAGGGGDGWNAFAGENLYLAQPAAASVDVVRLARGSRCLPADAGQLADQIDLLAGDSVTYTVRGKLLSSASGEVAFAAAATPSEAADPGAEPNAAATADPVLFKADLQLAKSDGLTTAIAGLPLHYEIAVANLGPSDVHGITLSDVYPLFPAAAGGFTSGTLAWSCSGADALQPGQQRFDGAGGIDGLGGALQMAVSPDGRSLYVAGSADDAVAVFTRDPASGALSFAAVVKDGDSHPGGIVAGLGGAADLAVSPDGRNLYVAAESSGSLVIFRRDPGSGALGFLRRVAAGIDGLAGAAGVAISADGASVYVAGKEAGTLVVFARDPANGDLAFVERERDGFGGVPAGVLLGARALLLSGGDRFLLVAAQQADALVVFARDPADGSLSFVRAVRDGDPQGEVAVDGLDLVFSLAESPDHRFLYTAALGDDALGRFAWEAESGELTYLGLLRNGLAGATLLDGASAIALSPDGRYLFAAAANSDAVSLFRRDDASGQLERIEVLRQGVGGITSLDNPRALVALGDDLYVSAATSNSLLSARLAPRAICGRAGALGEAPAPFDLDAGATVLLSASGTVHPSARGNCDGDLQDLLSPISAVLPPDVLDETLPNLALDGDDLRGNVDLAVAMTDNQVSVAAGTPTTYAVTITNAGAPSDSLGARVVGSTSPNLEALSWTCSAGPGAACAAPAGSGPLDVAIDVRLGSRVTLQVTSMALPAATGTVQQTVTVLPEPCETDLAPASNTVTDRNAVVRVADLALDKSGPDTAEPGQVIFFEIVARNLGPSDGEGTVADLLPQQLRRAVWSCVPSGGASCPVPAGSGDVLAPLLLPVFSEATITVAGEVDIAALGSLVNNARIDAAATVIDALQGNNADGAEVELLDVVIFHDGFESGDTTAWDVFGLAGEEAPDAGLD